MAEWSGRWSTTSGSTTGDQVASYTQSHDATIQRVTAACWGYQGIAPGYLNELKATVTGANTVQVATGGAMVDGKAYENSAAVNVNVPSASGAGNTRIDRIVLRATWASYDVAITRIAGTDAASPTAPAITTTSGTTYDVTICRVLVNTAGSCTVTDERDFASPPELAIAVLGVAGNTSVGTYGAIQAASDHTVLQRHGTSAGWAQVQAGMYAADSITTADLGPMVAALMARQGGSATNWATYGTTGYTTGMNARIQVGSVAITGEPTSVTFPTAFSNAPVVVPVYTASPDYVAALGGYPTSAGFLLYRVGFDGALSTGGAALWIAVGPE